MGHVGAERDILIINKIFLKKFAGYRTVLYSVQLYKCTYMYDLWKIKVKYPHFVPHAQVEIE